MALIKVVCLFFGFLFLVNPFSAIYAKSNFEKLPFDVNQVIEKVTKQQKPYRTDLKFRFRRNPQRITESLQSEFLLDTTIIFGPADDAQGIPAVVFDGTNYFVVWVDHTIDAIFGTRVSSTCEVLDKPAIKIADVERSWGIRLSVAFGTNYLVVWDDGDYNRNVYGIRVTTEGTVLDTVPIEICATEDDQWQPSVTFGASNFFVVWRDRRGAGDNIYGARISVTGLVLDSLGIPIDTAFEYKSEPAVIFGEDKYFVVWEDGRSDTSYDIYGTRVDSNGVVLDPIGIPISTAPDYQESPVITYGGRNFFVSWQDYRNITSLDIYGARVSSGGIVLDDTGIPISIENNEQENSKLAFDGTNYIAVWEDWREWSTVNIYCTRISTAGIVLDPNGIKVCTTSVCTTYFLKPAVVWAGTNYLVVWEDLRFDGDVFGTRITTEGTILDPAGILLSMGTNKQTLPQIAFDGSNYLVVWEDYRTGYCDIYGTRIDSNGTILDPAGIPISTAPHDQRYPKIVFGGNHYFVVWQDYRTGNAYSDIYGTRINMGGVVLDTVGFPISNERYDQYFPQVVFGNRNYFVVWIDRRSGGYYDLYGARVDTSGIVWDPDGIRISTTIRYNSSFQVIYGGIYYFIVWEDYRVGYYYDIYGTRVDMYGDVLDPAGIPISTAIYGQYSPQVTFAPNCNNYFIVWQDNRRGQKDIYGTRVTTTGTVVDPIGIPISTTNRDQKFPQIVFDGIKYFIIWQDYRNIQSDIYGTRVNTNGVVLDTAGIKISSGVLSSTPPQLIFDSIDYVIIYEDFCNGLDNCDIYGARVNTSSLVFDNFMVSDQPGMQRYPVIIHGAGNQSLIAYEGWTETIGGKGYNTFRIWGNFAPSPGIEEQNDKSYLTSIILSNFPNPFQKMTTLKYSINQNGNVSIKIYDIAGKLVRNLVNGNKEPGIYSITWDGTNDLRQKLPAGVYFYRLNTANSITETKELVILR